MSIVSIQNKVYDQEIFLSNGHVDRNSWRAAVLTLAEDDDGVRLSTAEALGRKAVVIEDERLHYRTWWSALRDFPLTGALKLQAWMVSMSSRVEAIIDIVPGRLQTKHSYPFHDVPIVIGGNRGAGQGQRGTTRRKAPGVLPQPSSSALPAAIMTDVHDKEESDKVDASDDDGDGDDYGSEGDAVEHATDETTGFDLSDSLDDPGAPGFDEGPRLEAGCEFVLDAARVRGVHEDEDDSQDDALQEDGADDVFRC